MPLTGSQKRHLRGLAHHLAPVVHVGKASVTEAVIAATSAALADHELIKVRLPQLGREERGELARSLGEATDAQLAGITGRVALLYRRHPDEPKIALPRRGGAPDAT